LTKKKIDILYQLLDSFINENNNTKSIDIKENIDISIDKVKILVNSKPYENYLYLYYNLKTKKRINENPIFTIKDNEDVTIVVDIENTLWNAQCFVWLGEDEPLNKSLFSEENRFNFSAKEKGSLDGILIFIYSELKYKGILYFIPMKVLEK